VAATASASTSGRGADVNNGGVAASAAPADQFPYHVVVHSVAYFRLSARSGLSTNPHKCAFRLIDIIGWYFDISLKISLRDRDRLFGLPVP